MSADSLPTDALQHEIDTTKRHVFILASLENATQSSIIQKLTDYLHSNQPDIVISKVATDEKIVAINPVTDIIIAIGSSGMQSAEQNYPQTNKFYISTDPEKYKLDKKSTTNDAILYMAQSYCRQLQFIKLINKDWHTFSLLVSQEKPVDTEHIRQCAKEFNLETHLVETVSAKYMTASIKDALQNSDVLLALPDSSIYNSKTIKNILLTSYRLRKPIIGFSHNFVHAGALAAVHSSTDQIAHTAGKLIEQYFKQDNKFSNPVNYPQQFDISINNQVFRALEINLPDIDKLMIKLENNDAHAPGKSP